MGQTTKQHISVSVRGGDATNAHHAMITAWSHEFGENVSSIQYNK